MLGLRTRLFPGNISVTSSQQKKKKTCCETRIVPMNVAEKSTNNVNVTEVTLSLFIRSHPLMKIAIQVLKVK